jgi:hypothetical protein
MRKKPRRRTIAASDHSFAVSVRLFTCPLSSTKLDATKSAMSAWRAEFMATENKIAWHISTDACSVVSSNARPQSAASCAAPMWRRLYSVHVPDSASSTSTPKLDMIFFRRVFWWFWGGR